MKELFLMAAAVCLLITTEAFNPFACDCKNDKKGGGKPDNGLPPVIEAEVTSNVCKAGWTPENDRCYYIGRQKKTYEDAQAFCQENGGNLVAVEGGYRDPDPEFWNLKHLALENGLNDYYWIGEKQERPAYLFWSSPQGVRMGGRWWAKGQPVVSASQPPQCVTMGKKIDHFKLYNFDCAEEKPFICVETCPAGWYHDSESNQCFMLSTESKTWDDAKKYCLEQWAEFPYFTNAKEPDFLKQTRIEKGLTDNKYWIGVYQKMAKRMVFGPAFNLNLFHRPVEPDNWKTENKQCVNMCSADEDYEFCDDNCTDKLQFICKKKAQF